MASVHQSTFSEKRLEIWKDYVNLTKPRIIKTNLITAFGGYWVASRGFVDLRILVAMLAGIALIMASACVLNNYIDREEDKKMDRTRHRALPSGRLQPGNVLVYGIILGILGTLVLMWVNPLTVMLALLAFFVYVVVYTLWLKRTSTWSTSIGGISGALPPVIGYCSITGEVDMGAWLLFVLMFLWQPPHSWALGIRRMEEYRNAGFPLLPVVKGIRRTKLQMIPYVALLLPVGYLFYHYGYAGPVFLAVSILTGAVWLAICLSGFMVKDDHTWANKTFYFSLLYLTINFVVMVLDAP